jgi:hypothetical protein
MWLSAHASTATACRPCCFSVFTEKQLETLETWATLRILTRGNIVISWTLLKVSVIAKIAGSAALHCARFGHIFSKRVIAMHEFVWVGMPSPLHPGQK